MKNRFSRIVGLMFVLSMLLSPQAAVYSSDTPVISPDQGLTENTERQGDDATNGTPDGDDTTGTGDTTPGDGDEGTTGDADETTGSDDGVGDDGSTGNDDTSGEGDNASSGEGDDESTVSDDGSAADEDSATEDDDSLTGDDETGTDEGDEKSNDEGSDLQKKQVDDEESDKLTKDDSSFEVMAAADPSDVTISSVSFDQSSNELEIGLFFANDVTFTDATIELSYDPAVLDLTGATDVTSATPLTVSVNAVTGTITITINGDAIADSNATIGIGGTINEVSFPACEWSVDGYTNTVTTSYSSTHGAFASSQELSGDDCAAALPAADLIWFHIIRFNVEDDVMWVDFELSGTPIPGSTVTFTYPSSVLSLDETPVPVENWFGDGDGFQIAIIQADNSSGTVTITFLAIGDGATAEGDYINDVPGQLLLACDPGAGVYVVDVDTMTYVASNGQSFADDEYSQLLCNASAPTKSGEWIVEGESMTWTIDTGDVFGITNIEDYVSWQGLEFDCGEGQITVETISGSFSVIGDVSDQCYTDLVEVALQGNSDEPYRARITLTTTVTESLQSYVNCAYVNSNIQGEGGPDLLAAQASVGLGGEACFELFQPGGGDFVTKTVNKTEVKSGEVVTYSIEVSTTADQWVYIEVNDEFPDGFVINESSITCVVEPVVFATDPCYSIADGTLYVGLEAWETPSAAVTLTLTFSGTVTGDVGDVITNEVCSEREHGRPDLPTLMAVGDPTIPGGGVICDTASVTIIGDPPASETPTPDPDGTPDPATPGATPTSTSEVDADPRAASAVTGLPETGNGGSGTSPFMLLAAMAASILLAMAVGMRTRQSR